MVGIFIGFPKRNGHPIPESTLHQRVRFRFRCAVDVHLIGNPSPGTNIHKYCYVVVLSPVRRKLAVLRCCDTRTTHLGEVLYPHMSILVNFEI